MNLNTNYMGLKLKNPLIIGSSTLTDSFDNIKKCIDFGAGGIVLKSLFEEELRADRDKLMYQDDNYFWYPDAIDQINKYSKERGVNEYLDLIKKVKDYKSEIPLFASVHCNTPYEWPKFAKTLEEAGADALELNIYIFPFDKDLESIDIEKQYYDIVREVKQHAGIPVTVKIGYGFTNVTRHTYLMQEAGADGLVLFNRFYRPDIDIEEEAVVRADVLSEPGEITQGLRWTSLLSGMLDIDICAGRGIHNAEGVIKQLMAGASATQICSTLYNNGLGYIDTILFDLEKWMEKHFYNALSDFQGKISKANQNIKAFEKVQYSKEDKSSINYD
jgi:dihydroorotate dehydrogenase (fumarate)